MKNDVSSQPSSRQGSFMIEFCNVSVCYDPAARHPVNAITDVNLKIDKGDWVFLVGPSGAGKSTLLKLLHCGLQAPTRISGRIVLDGKDITNLPAREIPFVRRKTGVVFQDFQLLAQKTAWENIAFALRVIGAPQRRIAREVPRVLDTVGLAHKAHAQPHELSGGEQQRIAIARAIVNNPALLLADEPTGNLDPETADGIAEVLRRINEEMGTTVVMATHDRNLVDSMKRRVVRVRDGGIASDDACGIYHPEDDEPATINAIRAGNAERDNAERDNAERESAVHERPLRSSAAVSRADSAGSTPGTAKEHSHEPAPVEAPVKNKTRFAEPQDAFARGTLENTAPLGSDENPIVQYGKK
jgi:cell division transport system ATP-binding protein